MPHIGVDSSSGVTPIEQPVPISRREDRQVVLILVGLTGSGKSTFAEALEAFFPNFVRCNQDTLGSRRNVENAVARALEDGFSVCVDRTNFNESQRKHFVDIAQSFQGTTIWALVFDTPYHTCASRLQIRKNHPTITNPELGLSVLRRFSSEYRPPVAAEGFDRILSIKPHATDLYTREEIANILNELCNSPPLQSTSTVGSLLGASSNGGQFHSYPRSASPPPVPVDYISRPSLHPDNGEN